MSVVGHDRRTQEELDVLRTQGISALATFVGNNKYIHGGDKPTRVDAVIFGLLSSHFVLPGIQCVSFIPFRLILLTMYSARYIRSWNPKFVAEVRKHDNLAWYIRDIRTEWFPERTPIPFLEDV